MKLKRDRQEGIAMVEMAIVLPVLLLILFAIAEFGIAFAKFQVITNASSAAARAAALFRSGCTLETMQAAARNATDQFAGRLGLTADQLDPQITGSCSSETIKVTVSVDQPFPIIGALGSTTKQLTLQQTSTEFNLNALTNNAAGS